MAQCSTGPRVSHSGGPWRAPPGCPLSRPSRNCSVIPAQARRRAGGNLFGLLDARFRGCRIYRCRPAKARGTRHSGGKRIVQGFCVASGPAKARGTRHSGGKRIVQGFCVAKRIVQGFCVASGPAKARGTRHSGGKRIVQGFCVALPKMPSHARRADLVASPEEQFRDSLFRGHDARGGSGNCTFTGCACYNRSCTPCQPSSLKRTSPLALR